MGVESEEGRRKTGTKENGRLKKNKKRKQKVLHNHKQSHKFQKRENVGAFIFFFLLFAKIQEKTKPKDLLKSVPSCPCSSPLRGSHASPPWALEEF